MEELKVNTPLEIVYFDGVKMDILPYLDIIRKTEVWGICDGFHCWKKTYEKKAGLKDALNMAKETCRTGALYVRLPRVCDLQASADTMDMFNETVRILKENGVVVDAWFDDLHWTSEGKVFRRYANEAEARDENSLNLVRLMF